MKKLLLTLIVAFAFSGSIFAQAWDHWPEFDPEGSSYGDVLAVTAFVKIDGSFVEKGQCDNLEIAAFVGDEIRGKAYLLDDYDFLPHAYCELMVQYDNNGEDVSFKLWDNATETLYETWTCNYTIKTGDEDYLQLYMGDYDNTVVFSFTASTPASITKDIVGYDNEGGGYYLIASPVGEVNPDDVDMMKSNIYDLYWFKQDGDDEGKEWMNYKTESFSLVPGKGYLYANSQDITLTFFGNAYTGNGTFPLEFVENAEFEGMNLVGNPYEVEAYVDLPFYTMNVNGAFVPNESNVAIPAMEGVFVVATGADQTVTFSKQGGKKVSHLALNLVNSSKLVDRAIVNFDETQQLPKFQLNANSTKLYFPMSDKDYAVVSCQDMGELPLNFKAEKSGSYTLAVNSQDVSFAYLHLIDNLNGSDTDLLANPSYSFEASTADYASRFKLVFATGNNDNDDNFAYYSNGTWVINNDGKANVQVVDVTGRILSNEQIEGCYSLNFNAAPGVYMIRLVNGDNVKVQKVVVK